jgi:hypothetical protein
MGNIENALKKLQKNYPKSLNEFYPGYGDGNGIPERNLTYQFVSAYLSLNKSAHGFFEVPFKNDDEEVNHYDAIIIDKPALIIIEAKRLFNRGKAKSIENDVRKIMRKRFHNQIRNNINNFIPKRIYGLILAEAWPRKFDTGLGDWWKGSKVNETYKNWVKDRVCGNMRDWKRNAIEISYEDMNEKGEGKTDTFHILYGYKRFS